MASKKQIAANRRNSQHCTGPKTEAGKTICRWNALRHGFYSDTLILPGEDPAQFDNIRGGFEDLYQPQNDAERHLVNQLAILKWKMLRAELLEANALVEHADDIDGSLLIYDRVTQIHCRLWRAWSKTDQELRRITEARLYQPLPLTTPARCCTPDSPPNSVATAPTASESDRPMLVTKQVGSSSQPVLNSA